jgi:hypothetical protein
MSFIANNLNDEDFAKFVALTLQNRGFWEQISDKFVTKLYQCRDLLTGYGIKFLDFIWVNGIIYFSLQMINMWLYDYRSYSRVIDEAAIVLSSP